jgi:hypothetical protein
MFVSSGTVPSSILQKSKIKLHRTEIFIILCGFKWLLLLRESLNESAQENIWI